MHANDHLVEKFEDWAIAQHRKVAPGFDASLGVMQPKRHAQVPEPDIPKQLSNGNSVPEMDAAFGRANLDLDAEP